MPEFPLLFLGSTPPSTDCQSTCPATEKHWCPYSGWSNLPAQSDILITLEIRDNSGELVSWNLNPPVMATLPAFIEWNAAMIESFTNQVNHLPTWCLSCPPMPSCEKCWANEVFVPKRWLSRLGTKPYQAKRHGQKSKKHGKHMSNVEQKHVNSHPQFVSYTWGRSPWYANMPSNPEADWRFPSLWFPRSWLIFTTKHGRPNSWQIKPSTFLECFTYSTPFLLDFENEGEISMKFTQIPPFDNNPYKSWRAISINTHQPNGCPFLSQDAGTNRCIESYQSRFQKLMLSLC